jgi:putative transposase
MPRGLHRTYGAHQLHFITCSRYWRLPLQSTARSRDRFLSILEQTRQRYRVVVVGYVVMQEHIHLLITEPRSERHPTVMQVPGAPFFRVLCERVGLFRRASRIRQGC